ncbi:hypothetical protein GCM10027187_04530 [Streptosporangium sandarakinum]
MERRRWHVQPGYQACTLMSLSGLEPAPTCLPRLGGTWVPDGHAPDKWSVEPFLCRIEADGNP